MTHLQRALSANDEDDHAHYIMAVALTGTGLADVQIHANCELVGVA